jgi:hypothetical protein
MKNFLLCLGLIFALGCQTSTERSNTPGKQTVYEWNGTTLDGWVPMHGGTWTVESGAIVGRNGKDWSTNPEKSGSWLRSPETYDNFEWDLEYSIRGNGGLFFRSALEKNPAFTGYEMQLLADHGRAASKHGTGSIYDLIAPTKNKARPAGEWNQVTIRAVGPKVEITLNGEKIIDAQLQRSAMGYLGIQSHDENTEIRVRKMRIRRL